MADCVKEKDPDATLDFGFNWEPWLDGDTIATSIWIVPDGITKDSDLFTVVGITTIWLSGGTLYDVYRLVNRITTVGGRKNDRTLVIKMVSK